MYRTIAEKEWRNSGMIATETVRKNRIEFIPLEIASSGNRELEVTIADITSAGRGSPNSGEQERTIAAVRKRIAAVIVTHSDTSERDVFFTDKNLVG